LCEFTNISFCYHFLYLIINLFIACRYKESFTRLRTLKTEIEHLQHLLEKSKVRLMKDFEMWWAEQVNMSQVSLIFIVSG